MIQFVNKNQNILVVSHNSFSSVRNNGKTLESIFSTHPKNNIAQLYFSEIENPDYNFCENYFQVTDKEIFASILGRNLDRDPVNRIVSNIEIPKNNTVIINYLKRKSRKIAFLRDILWSSGKWKTNKLFSWIEEFKPDHLFYVGGLYGFSHSIVLYISKRYQIPLNTFYTDDYLLYPEYKSILEKIQRKRMWKFYTKVINHSNNCFAIGTEMAKEYSKAFNKEFYPIMNSVEIIPRLENTYRDKYVNVSYFGGLHLNRWEMLVKIGKLFKEAEQQIRKRIIFNVYSYTECSQDILSRFRKNNIHFQGPVSGKNFKKALIEANVLIHVESEDKYYRSLTRLSVSTKIPEYLISGKIILAYGPEELASMKILIENKIGYFISPRWSEEMQLNKVINFFSDFKSMKNVSDLAYNFAVRNFDMDIVSKNFIKKLIEE